MKCRLHKYDYMSQFSQQPQELAIINPSMYYIVLKTLVAHCLLLTSKIFALQIYQEIMSNVNFMKK